MVTSLRRRTVRVLLLIVALLAAFGTATALAASPTVTLKDDFFSAKKLSVSRGTSVTWKWAGSLNHTVTVKSGPAKFSSKLQVRGTNSHRFTVRGTYTLYCKIHRFMKMTVVVH